jgi:hypothetical protein
MSEEKPLNNSSSSEEQFLSDIRSSQEEIKRARAKLKGQFEWIREFFVILPIFMFKILVGRPIHVGELSYISGMEKEKLRKISKDLSALLFPPGGLVICRGKNLLRGTKMMEENLKHGKVRVAVPRKVGGPKKNAGELTRGGMPSSYDLFIDRSKLLKLTEKESEELRELISSPNSSAIKSWCDSFFHLIKDSLPLVVQGVELWFNFCYEELMGMYLRFLEVVDCISPELKAKTEFMLFPILSGIGEDISDPQVIQKIKNAIPTIWSEWMNKMSELNEKQYLEEALLSTYKERGELASRLNFYISEMPKAFKVNGPV